VRSPSAVQSLGQQSCSGLKEERNHLPGLEQDKHNVKSTICHSLLHNYTGASTAESIFISERNSTDMEMRGEGGVAHVFRSTLQMGERAVRIIQLYTTR
jgi:hypothetical protein